MLHPLFLVPELQKVLLNKKTFCRNTGYSAMKHRLCNTTESGTKGTFSIRP